LRPSASAHETVDASAYDVSNCVCVRGVDLLALELFIATYYPSTWTPFREYIDRLIDELPDNSSDLAVIWIEHASRNYQIGLH